MGMIKRVYGRDGQHSTCYLTRIKLTPKTRWGQLYFHIFHRGDLDRAFHDHPYDFWTFPFRTYYERVLDLDLGRERWNVVKAFRWHFRPAEYIHIQEGAARYIYTRTAPDGDGYRRLLQTKTYGGWTATLIWRKPTRRAWGFWMRPHPEAKYFWTPWREYVYS